VLILAKSKKCNLVGGSGRYSRKGGDKIIRQGPEEETTVSMYCALHITGSKKSFAKRVAPGQGVQTKCHTRGGQCSKGHLVI